MPGWQDSQEWWQFSQEYASFSNLKELEKVIENYLAERNEKPRRYVWKAEGKKILEKINRARKKLGWEPYCEVNSNSGH